MDYDLELDPNAFTSRMSDLELDPYALYGLGADLDLVSDGEEVVDSPEIDPECVEMRNRLKNMILMDSVPSRRRNKGRSQSFSESNHFDHDAEEVFERDIDTMSVRDDTPNPQRSVVKKATTNPLSKAEKVKQSLGSVSEVFLQIFQALLLLLQHQNPVAQQQLANDSKAERERLSRRSKEFEVRLNRMVFELKQKVGTSVKIYRTFFNDCLFLVEFPDENGHPEAQLEPA